MKKLFLLLLFIPVISYSQWQPDVRLTNDPAISFTSRNNARCVAASGNVLHVVWYDYRDAGNSEIYYKRSTDGGISWGADTRLTNNTAFSERPSVSVSGSVVHVVWYDQRDGNLEIYYKRSTDAGVSWGSDTRLTNNSATSYNSSVTVSGQVVHLVWSDTRDGNFEIYYKSSTDGGVSWEADTRLTNNGANSESASVSVSGQFVHVVWHDDRDGNLEIYYKRSTNGGVSWGADTRLTNNSSLSAFPSVSTSGQVVHVVWYDYRDSGNTEIYYKRSTDGGIIWGADTRLTDNSADSFYPSISASGLSSTGGVHVVWEDNRDGNFEIYYKRSTDGGIIWGADTRLTINSDDSYYPSVAVSGSAVHVVWYDGRDGNYEIYYKRDPTGNPVGIKSINSKIPENFSLSQNYPNPFNPNTHFQFRIAELGFVSLKVYDVLGNEVATIVNEQLQPGTYEADWNASNYPSGLYFYKIITGNFTDVRKMFLIK